MYNNRSGGDVSGMKSFFNFASQSLRRWAALVTRENKFSLTRLPIFAS